MQAGHWLKRAAAEFSKRDTLMYRFFFKAGVKTLLLFMEIVYKLFM
jgi:hypothetical protein